MIVDAHHHFWRIDRGVYDWIEDSIWPLRRDYLPEHLAPYLSHLGIDKTILVQASETLSENPFLMDMAETAGFVGGIVAWADLAAPDAIETLGTLAQHPIIKGVRPVLQGIDDTNWILRPEVLAALRHFPELGLRFDALVQPRHLPVIAKLSQAIPELQIVIDHAAKPKIANGLKPEAEWHAGMVDLAQNQMIYCKLSGLATEFGPGWSSKTLSPISELLLSSFGSERLMWGSDWPVLELDGSYSQWFSQAQAMISKDDQELVFGNTAARFYGLK